MANWTDSDYKMSAKLEVQWDGAAWTDESSRLMSATGTMTTLPLWQFAGTRNVQPSWRMTLQMYNQDDRFSAANASSPINPYIASNKGYGIKMRFEVGVDDGAGGFTYTRLFTGYIDAIQLTSTRLDTATFSCIDNSHVLIQSRLSTTMYLDTPLHTFMEVVANDGGIQDVDLTFDNALFTVPFLWLDDEQAWEQINWMAHSEGGFVYFDRDGELYFENAEAFLIDARHTASQFTFTVSNMVDLQPQFQYQNAYNEVIVQAMPRAEYGRSILYELDRAFKVAPGETETIVARLRYPQASLPVPVAGTDYHIRTKGGDDLSASTSISLSKQAQRVDVDITNSSTVHAAVLYDFRLWGRPVAGRATIQEKLQATDSDIGNPTTGPKKTLVVSGNPYIQTQLQARFLVNLLRDRVKIGRWLYRVRGAPMQPTLIPMDRVTVVEADSGINDTGYILTVNWTYNGQSLKADYEIIDDGSWFPYNTYFELGVDTLGAGSTERAYY